jgi:hypothetical protein
VLNIDLNFSSARICVTNEAHLNAVQQSLLW